MSYEVEIPQPPVKSYCKLCARTWVYNSEDDYAVVSPAGVMHIGGDYGFTACGFDATGKTWWWRL